MAGFGQSFRSASCTGCPDEGRTEPRVYVFISSLVLILLFWQWRPLPAVVWSVEAELARNLLWIVFGAGFGLVFISTFLIDHFDLSGLKQVPKLVPMPGRVYPGQDAGGSLEQERT